MIFKALLKWYKNRNVSAEKVELDSILSSAKSCNSYSDRIYWLSRLFIWLRTVSDLAEHSSDLKRESYPTLRLKYLMIVLNRHPDQKVFFVNTFRDVFKEITSIELFTEVGMSHENSFLSELHRRILKKILLDGAPQKSLTTLFEKIFPEDQDIEWVEALDEAVLVQFISLIGTSSFETDAVHRDLENAIIFLVSQVRATGFHKQIRSRLQISDFRNTPFFLLEQKTLLFLMALSTGSHEKVDLNRIELLKVLGQCKSQVKSIYTYLEQNGVSVSVIFSIDQLIRQIDRIEFLLNLRDIQSIDVRLIKMFIVQMISDLHESRGVRKFIWHNIHLVLRKVVERNSEIGEHYITNTPKDYWLMFKSAGGGGVITGFTVLVKFLLAQLSLSPFGAGLVASVNYSTSFLLIHFNHFTLATKQPASTAPIIAAKLAHLKDDNLTDFVDDMARVIRSQFAAVLGNLTFVIPTILGLGFLYFFLFGKPLITEDYAHYTIKSVSLLGPSAIYAAFTGFLLFAASLSSGWIDNWFVFHGIGDRIAQNEKVIFAVGNKAARIIGLFVKKNIAGISGNVTLALCLGLIPEIFKFLGVPLDVRHVTLSTGSIFAAVPTLGWEIIASREFILALCGIGVIGVLNVGVSFALALGFAVLAKGLQESRRNFIFKKFLSRAMSRPWQFILPVKLNK
jgi:site-specific recombinase